MSLERALARLALDAESERTIRDVLVLFTHHPREPMTERDVAMRTGRREAEIGGVLEALSGSYVLDFDSGSEAYTFSGDVVLGFEIDAFKRRVDSHQSHVTTNVARFRQRHGL